MSKALLILIWFKTYIKEDVLYIMTLQILVDV